MPSIEQVAHVSTCSYTRDPTRSTQLGESGTEIQVSVSRRSAQVRLVTRIPVRSSCAEVAHILRAFADELESATPTRYRGKLLTKKRTA